MLGWAIPPLVAGKISDIFEEVTAKNNAVKFMLKVDKEDLGQPIEFSNFKVWLVPRIRRSSGIPPLCCRSGPR